MVLPLKVPHLFVFEDRIIWQRLLLEERVDEASDEDTQLIHQDHWDGHEDHGERIRDYHIDAQFHYPTGLLHCVDLMDNLCPDSVGPLDEIAWIADG
jgi:hypothetical protein